MDSQYFQLLQSFSKWKLGYLCTEKNKWFSNIITRQLNNAYLHRRQLYSEAFSLIQKKCGCRRKDYSAPIQEPIVPKSFCTSCMSIHEHVCFETLQRMGGWAADTLPGTKSKHFKTCPLQNK